MNERPKELKIAPFLFNLVLGIFLGTLVWNLDEIEPRHVGFYCEDDSIRRTYLGNTISLAALFSGLFLTPAITILVCEWIRSFKRKEVFKYRGIRVNQILPYFVIYNGYSALVFLIVLVLVTGCKLIVGRLRPYFIEVCKPIFEDPSCQNVTFISFYECTGTNINGIRESRKSFFSGHAATSMGVAVFLAIYLHYRLPMKSYLIVLRHMLQIGLICLALYVGYTRITDNMHHCSDVVVGYFVGVLIGTFPWFYIGEGRHQLLLPVGFSDNYPYIDDSISSEERRYKTSVSRLEPGELRVFET